MRRLVAFLASQDSRQLVLRNEERSRVALGGCGKQGGRSEQGAAPALLHNCSIAP